MANFLEKFVKELDWNKCVNKRGRQDVADFNQEEAAKQILFGGHVYKLHGDMDHSDRKQTYFGFDKNPACLLICTDVASRGLDFKNVQYVIQWDPTSNPKEYVNRIGRTARIASSGSSIVFIMPQELKYIEHLKEKHGIVIQERNRFVLRKEFEETMTKKMTELKKDVKLYDFRLLKKIEDKDEKQECLHCIRQMVTSLMLNENTNLQNMA